MNKKMEITILCVIMISLTGCAEQGNADQTRVLHGEKIESVSDGNAFMTSSNSAESDNVDSGTSEGTGNTDSLMQYDIKWDGLSEDGMDETIFLGDVDFQIDRPCGVCYTIVWRYGFCFLKIKKQLNMLMICVERLGD